MLVIPRGRRAVVVTQLRVARPAWPATASTSSGGPARRSSRNSSPRRRWAARLAPEEVPDFSGFEIGRVYQAGSGLMAGDFFDVHRVGPTRVAAVIGDVAGHGIESSITAFQAKYLLRVFLRQFRDPAQAFEELNAQLAAGDRHEEFISAAVIVFDTEAGTLRYASAGHPAGVPLPGGRDDARCVPPARC